MDDAKEENWEAEFVFLCSFSLCAFSSQHHGSGKNESDGAPLSRHRADNGKSCPASCVAELVEAGTSFPVQYQCVCVDMLD